MGQFANTEPKSFIQKAAEATKEENERKNVIAKTKFETPTFKNNEEDIQETISCLLDNPELKEEQQTINAMLYGVDGTGKTGVALDFLTNEDIKAGKRLLIIDLDGGNIPLIKTHHIKRVTDAGRTLSDVFMIKNPLELSRNADGDYEVDYHKTFANIMKMIEIARNHGKELKIKAVIFDGLSTALKHAERLMRLDKNIAADGGVQTRYWLVRNQIFEETLEQIKSLSMSKIFIAHDNFIMLENSDKEASKVIQKANAMMHQKLRCIRRVNGDKTEFKVIVDKNKYNTASEAATIVFCTVDNKEQKVLQWDTAKIWKTLQG